MSLLNGKDKQDLPQLYSTEESEDPIVWVRALDPAGSESLFITEYDGYDVVFGYGMVDGKVETEGFFSINELLSNRMMKDIHWEPVVLSKAIKEEARVMGVKKKSAKNESKSLKVKNLI
jgi:hypothetical protein